MQTKTKDLLKITIASVCIVVLFFGLVPNIKVGNFKDISEQSFAKIVPSQDTQKFDIGVEQINDYAPIFIPTKFNCTPKKSDLPKISNISIFKTESKNINENISIAPPQRKTKDLNALKNTVFMQNAFSGYGINSDSSTILKKGSILIIKDIVSGNIVLKKQLPEIDEIYIVEISEFSLRVTSGIAQTPILTKSTGKDSIDKTLLEIVQRISSSLPNGNYNAQIIP